MSSNSWAIFLFVPTLFQRLRQNTISSKITSHGQEKYEFDSTAKYRNKVEVRIHGKERATNVGISTSASQIISNLNQGVIKM